MKSGHKVLYSCGNCDSGDFSHRILLLRTGSHCDSWISYLYNETTGAVLYRSNNEADVSKAEGQAQHAALRRGISPILSNKQEFAA